MLCHEQLAALLQTRGSNESHVRRIVPQNLVLDC